MAIVSPNFCSPYMIDLEILREVVSGELSVTDVNDDILLKVQGPWSSCYDKMILVDASDTPILTLKKYIDYARWQVFRGEGTNRSELLYSLNVTSRIKQSVTLADNEEMEECDFVVKGSSTDQSFVVYAGESDVIVAKMNKEHVNCVVSVYPDVDYAFIFSLIVISDNINREDSDED